MDELVFKSEKGNPVTTSLIVAEKFKKNHKDVLRAIRNLNCSDNFHKRNFAPMNYIGGGNGRNLLHHVMTKDGFMFLVMGFTGELAGEFKEKFIDAFNKMEIALINKIPNFNNPVEAARAWADEVEKKQLAENKIKELEPKAESFDVFIDSSSLQGFKEVANMLGYGRNKLMDKLRKLKILTSKNIPYQQYLNMGLFEVKESTQNSFNVAITYVTPKGIDYIRKKITMI